MNYHNRLSSQAEKYKGGSQCALSVQCERLLWQKSDIFRQKKALSEWEEKQHFCYVLFASCSAIKSLRAKSSYGTLNRPGCVVSCFC